LSAIITLDPFAAAFYQHGERLQSVTPARIGACRMFDVELAAG
jgi:hypothetical protein